MDETANALVEAVRAGDIVRVRELLRAGTNPDERDDWDESPVEAAADRRDRAMFLLLAEFGADISSRDARGATRVHDCVKGSDAPEWLTTLLDAGLEVNATDRERWTPLHLAAAYGYGRSAEVLLSRGADKSARTQSGLSPADLAETNGFARLAEQLRPA